MDIFINVLIGVGSFTLFFVVGWLVFGAFLKGEKNTTTQAEREFIREYVTVLCEGQVGGGVASQPPAKFVITRQDIVNWTRTLGDTDITVSEKTDDPQMPHSLRWKNKTFSLAYGTDAGVLLIARIPDTYAAELSKVHKVTRSKFPKGPCWWAIPIVCTWKSKEAVLEVLNTSVNYVRAKTVKPKTTTK